MIAVSTLRTDFADRYLRQMCKHFGHKLPVEEAEDGANIAFAMGTAKIRSQGDTLIMAAAAESADDLDRVSLILGSHLERFAFRKNLTATWENFDEKEKEITK